MDRSNSYSIPLLAADVKDSAPDSASSVSAPRLDRRREL